MRTGALALCIVSLAVLARQAGAQPADKGFVVRNADGTHELRLTGKLQTYFLGTAVDVGGDRTATGLFEIHRGRLGSEGKLGAKVLYKEQTELGKGNAHLKDFRLDVALGRGVWLRAGQWKRPFSRQFMNSSFRLEMVERAITDKAFGTGRDIGVALRNDYEQSVPIEWTIGIFDGLEDEKSTVSGDVMVDPITGEGELEGGTLSNMPVTFKPVIVGRIGVNRGAVNGYSEGDLEGGPLRWGAATSILLEGDVDRDGRASHKAEADFVIKSCGWSGSGAVYLATLGSGFADATEPALFGAHAQVGVIRGGTVGINARYAVVTALGDNPAPDQHEVAAGVSYYVRGRESKLQLDVAARKQGDAGLADNLRIQVQGQIGF